MTAPNYQGLSRPILALKAPLNRTPSKPVPEKPQVKPPQAKPTQVIKKPEKAKRPPPAAPDREWRPDEVELQNQVKAGLAVVAKPGKHDCLIHWAIMKKKFINCARPKPWSNPYSTIGTGLSMAECLANYQKDLLNDRKKMAQVPRLKRKILVCKCSTSECHAKFLAGLANKLTKKPAGKKPAAK